jgi:2-oxo-4-hydroxy-4-carboxy--5-ureidoimidazoline (OHCU) decarboxylase
MSKVEDIAEARRRRAKQKSDNEYKEALRQIIERAKKVEWDDKNDQQN